MASLLLGPTAGFGRARTPCVEVRCCASWGLGVIRFAQIYPRHMDMIWETSWELLGAAGPSCENDRENALENTDGEAQKTTGENLKHGPRRKMPLDSLTATPTQEIQYTVKSTVLVPRVLQFRHSVSVFSEKHIESSQLGKLLLE